jgi:DNA processing protein
MSACDDCVRRAWLLRRMGGHLEPVRGRIDEVLALPADELIAAVGGRRRRAIAGELGSVDPDEERTRAAALDVDTVCRCDARYPPRLRGLAGAPSVLHVIGGLAWATRDPVAIVGARDATAYGLDVARSLGRALASAGVPVVSGLALGIDSAAHFGALAGGGTTVAVLPGPAERPYPASRKGLYRQILAAGGAVVSELPPGADVRRWSFPARNRIIAAVAAMTVVVEAGARSGALVTAAHAGAAGLPVGAVPGRVTTRQATGSNRLLAVGATVVRDAQDVLDRLFGAGTVSPVPEPRPALSPDSRAVLSAIARGQDSAAALARAGVSAERGLAVLAALELDGYVARGPGGQFRLLP